MIKFADSDKKVQSHRHNTPKIRVLLLIATLV